MGTIRQPFQGIWNIIRFNWHFYCLSLALLIILLFVRENTTGASHRISFVLLWLIVVATFISLIVSCYVYDFSNLYQLTWLDELPLSSNAAIINITAGFDETSRLLQDKFPGVELLVLDFYDPAKHTEISIKRARMAYPAFPGTQHVGTDHLPLQDGFANTIFAILSAHEIRNDDERIAFFKELGRLLRLGGRVIITEHIRDAANFFAYNIGFFHFHSKTTWHRTFRLSGFYIVNEIKITPFITTFILSKYGTAS